MAHLTARGWLVNTDRMQGPGPSITYLGIFWSGKTSLPLAHHHYTMRDAGFRDINSGKGL